MKFKTIIFFTLTFVCFSLLHAQTVDPGAQDGIMIFQFKPELQIQLPKLDKEQVDFHTCSFFKPVTDAYGIIEVKQLHPDIADKKLMNTYQVVFEEIYRIDELISYFQLLPEVEYAEPKTLHKLFITPNDQYFNSSNQWSLFKINAAQAWDISMGSESIVVAVTDNAIYTSHPDLAGKLVPGWDAAHSDNNPNPAGGNDGEHGTHVSGIVGAKTNNSIGVASIGFNTSVMPVKIGRDSDGALIAGYEGIVWAASNGADVINMSWGGGGYSSYGQNVINNAYDQGCILVAAAGNDGVNTQFYPAAYSNVIAVASTNSNDIKSGFSQYGTWITVSSPGSNILSTVPNTSYSYKDGTSMASPLVAGLIGLMKSVNPALPQADIINCLVTTCDNINAMNPNYLGQLGAGRINAYAAMQCMLATIVSFDAGISQIIQPTGTVCDSAFSPVVVLKNFGTVNLTDIEIKYQLDAGAVQTFNWTGNLALGQITYITLPALNPAPGGHTFRVFTGNPNNNPDENPGNNEKNSVFTMFSQGIALPFTETFESNSFTTNNWTILNPDNAVTWDIASVSGTSPGNKAARLNYFNYASTGQRDAMLTPPLNLSGYISAELTFQHAYRRYNSSVSDSLIVYVSTDCGITFQRVLSLGENGTGIFATGYTTTSSFVPASADDWCSGPVGTACKVINLTSFTGHENVVVKFEGFNNYSNNLYIDNINITGVPLTSAPTIQFSSSAGSICQNNSITFTDQSSPAVISRAWTFAGGNPLNSSSAQVSVTYNNPGTFDVSLEATNAIGTSTQNFPGYVTIYPLPLQQMIQQAGSTLSVSLQTGESLLWYRNGNPIPGADQPVFLVTQIGIYKAKITSEHGCSIFTNEINVNPTGFTESANESNSFIVVPNPADEDVYIFLEKETFYTTPLIITDLSGKVAAEYNILPGEIKIRINVSSLAAGTYMIHFKGKTFTDISKLVIFR